MSWARDVTRVSAKGLLILEMDDGSILQLKIDRVTANINREDDEILERSAAGHVAVHYTVSRTDLELQANVVETTMIKSPGVS